MTGVFFLGICIIYPNGLFNSYCFAVGPFAEYFASVFGCLVEGMNSCIVFTSRYVLECCCYNISFDVFLYKCSVVYRTFFSVYFLNCGSQNYYFRWSDPSRPCNFFLQNPGPVRFCRSAAAPGEGEDGGGDFFSTGSGNQYIFCAYRFLL